MDVTQIADKVSTEALVMRPISDWRPILARECQVYVLGENYIAKRFDHVNYKFCEKDEAKEVADKVKQAKTKDSLVLVMGSDLHVNETEIVRNAKISK